MSGTGLLVVNSSATWGGNELWAVRVAEGMVERGHRVRFAWCHDVVGERVASAGLDGVRIPMRNDADVSALLALRKSLDGADDETALEYGRKGGMTGLEGRVKEALTEE